MSQTVKITEPDRRLCVAPMMDWTDRHCRSFHRLLAPGALLYTEMVTAAALIHGDTDRLLSFNPDEHPVALQIGGADPVQLATAARMGEEAGYDEINLNVGCPSDRVQKGRFGACLMLEPDLVAECIDSMRQAVSVPVTVKCRIGVDDQDEDESLENFVSTVSSAGCNCFIVHARKAWLSGLSPAQNRDIPPLNRDRVYRLKQAHPDLQVIINGGLDETAETIAQLDHVDGVMIGRQAYRNPYWLVDLQQAVYGGPEPDSRSSFIDSMRHYIDDQHRMGVPVKSIVRHMLGLFQGQPGAKFWRRTISQNAHLPDASSALLERANPENRIQG